MDRLDRLAQEARELLAEIDAVLNSLPIDAASELSESKNLPMDDGAEDWL